jgi:hypothetical protein
MTKKRDPKTMTEEELAAWDAEIAADYRRARMLTKRSEKERFAMVPLAWAADIAKATGDSGAMILLLLAYLAWKERGPTFALSNEIATKYGISRWGKYRALARLEKAGKIRIQRRSGQALSVTLLSGFWS